MESANVSVKRFLPALHSKPRVLRPRGLGPRAPQWTTVKSRRGDQRRPHETPPPHEVSSTLIRVYLPLILPHARPRMPVNGTRPPEAPQQQLRPVRADGFGGTVSRQYAHRSWVSEAAECSPKVGVKGGFCEPYEASPREQEGLDRWAELEHSKIPSGRPA